MGFLLWASATAFMGGGSQKRSHGWLRGGDMRRRKIISTHLAVCGAPSGSRVFPTSQGKKFWHDRWGGLPDGRI